MLKTEKSYDIIILEKNNQEREILANELRSTVKSIPLNELYDFNFHLPETMDSFIEMVNDNDWLNTRTIAFLNTEQSYKSKKNDISLKGMYQKIKPVIIADNWETLHEYKCELKCTADADFILKNNYTLAVCSVLLEQFIERKS